MVAEQRVFHNDLQQCELIHPWRIEMCNLHCETESARGVRVSETGVEGGAATFMAHLLHKRDCASAWRRGVSNTRALEFESALERDTSMNSSLRDEGWIRVNNRESKWGDHHLPGVANTRQQEDASQMLEEYEDGHAMKSRAHGMQCGTADSSGPSSVGSSYTKAGRKSWWMQNTRKPGKKHYYMSDSMPVKRVTAVLHAREDVQRASSGDSEELSRRCECRSVAQTGQKYEPDVVIRYDVILRSLLKRRSGEHDERDLGCEINTLGAKRLSSSVERSIPRQQWSS